MNLYVEFSPGVQAEALVLSSIANWFISTKTSGPVNGQVQDSILGGNEITRSGVLVDKYHAMALFAASGVDPPRFDERPPDHLYTGRDIIGMLFRATPVNYRREPSSYSDLYAPFIAYNPEETLTVMEQGRLVRGVLDKKSIGAKATGGLFHLVSREYGQQRALDMIYAVQQVSLQFLLYRGFTVGTADLIPSRQALEKIRELVSAVVLESEVITDRLLRGELVPPIGSTVREFYEELQRAALKVDDSEIIRWVLGSMSPDTNGFFRMIAVGSKGSNANLIHVAGAIGQTKINGERIREQFAFRRTLPYFPRFATAPAAHGFVANSYVTGMRVSEYLFQNQNGRFDLINKALSTASTGYFMRKGIMSLQSALVDNHRRVTKDTKIVQFLYGEDGLDARELEKVDYRLATMSDAALREAVWVDADALEGSAEERAAAKLGVDQALAALQEDRAVFRKVFGRLEATNFGQSFTTEVHLPVNVRRLVESIFIKTADEPPPALTAASLSRRLAQVADLCDRLPYALLNEVQERRRAPIPEHYRAATTLLATVIRSELAPKTLARLSEDQLVYVAEFIRHRYSLSLIDYGSTAGILAVQAVSEPLTQYMLDSHHRSVGSGTNKAGLVRVSEIYSARDVGEEQSASMFLPLREDFLAAQGGATEAARAAMAQEVATSIEFVTLRQFVRRKDVLLEPVGALVYPPFAGDQEWIAAFERSHPLVRPPGDLTNWCFRFVLDKSMLVLKAVDLELIVRQLHAAHPALYIAHTHEAVSSVVIRGWARATLFRRGGETEERANEVCEGVLDTSIRGIPGVMGATVEKVKRMKVTPEGAFVPEELYAVRTTGTNFYRALLSKAVDPTRAITSSIGDTMKLLGIEATLSKIVSETQAFMEDNTPSIRHLYLYAYELTRTGKWTSVERGGLGQREPNNVLLRMAYGAPVQIVTDAALAGTRSKVYGIAAPQMLGSTPMIGSLYNGLVVDEEFVVANSRSVDSVLDEL